MLLQNSIELKNKGSHDISVIKKIHDINTITRSSVDELFNTTKLTFFQITKDRIDYLGRLFSFLQKERKHRCWQLQL